MLIQVQELSFVWQCIRLHMNTPPFQMKFFSLPHDIKFNLSMDRRSTDFYVCYQNPFPGGPSLRSDDYVGRPFCFCIVFSFSFFFPYYYFSSLPATFVPRFLCHFPSNPFQTWLVYRY